MTDKWRRPAAESTAGGKERERPQGGRLPEDLRELSFRIRRSEKSYERMSGKRHA